MRSRDVQDNWPMLRARKSCTNLLYKCAMSFILIDNSY